MAQSFSEDEDFKPRLDFQLWRKVARRALLYRAHIFPLAAVAAALAVIDCAFMQVMRHVIDTVAQSGGEAHRGRLLYFAGVYGLLVLALALCVFIFIYLAGRVTTCMSHDIRRDAFDRLQELSFSYFDRRPVGWLMSRLTSDCGRLADFVAWGLLDAVWAVSLMLAIAVTMLQMNWRLALLVLAAMPLLAAVSAVFKRLILKSSRVMRKMNSLMTASYNEGIMGVRTSKTLVREDENLAEFQKLSAEMFQASVRNAVQSAVYLPIVVSIGTLSAGLALWYGGVETASGALSLGTLVAFMGYAAQFFEPVNQMAHLFTQSYRAQASGERIFELLETVPEIKDEPEVPQGGAGVAARPDSASPVGRDARPTTVAGPASVPAGEVRIESIEFRDVCFTYKDGPAVLRNFNLKVGAGETIALVGPTGGGKSTLVSLVCRFYEPNSGEVLIDGVDYRKRGLHWLQSRLGVVLQTPHLFSGSVMENIRYGRLQASDDEVIAAARLVNAHEFILAMEKGYDSPVGEGGGRLSTGQRQLVSFARAILADPRIFIMDEATSSVDTQTEQLIQKGLEKVLKGRISFVIAHRLSTIRSADRILLIEDGKIVEQGKHQELIRRRGRYFELYTHQFVQEKEAELLRK